MPDLKIALFPVVPKTFSGIIILIRKYCSKYDREKLLQRGNRICTARAYKAYFLVAFRTITNAGA